MDLYVLDSLLRRRDVVDEYESLIWTERFSSTGDFALEVKSTRTSRTLFVEGALLAIRDSHRVMVVENISNATDAEGRAILKVSGLSLESILQSRVARNSLANLAVEPTWNITGKPGDIARKIFDDICVRGTLNLGDKIPFIQPGTIFPADTIAEPQGSIAVQLSPKTVYDTIKEICDAYDLGFRLVRNLDTSQLYFNIYAGNDRTTRQRTKDPVIFALDYHNLKSTNEFTSIEKAKNTAYVLSERGTAVVYGERVPSDVDGFDRRVLLVTAQNIDANTVDVQGALVQQGREALAKSRSFTAFEGEVSQRSQYVYGKDYILGDVVEVRSTDGVVAYKRVSEQIFVSDGEGEKSYPTFSMNSFIAANTWLAQPKNKVWQDFGATEFWNTL